MGDLSGGGWGWVVRGRQRELETGAVRNVVVRTNLKFLPWELWAALYTGQSRPTETPVCIVHRVSIDL